MSYTMNSSLPDPYHQAAFYEGVSAKRLFAWVIDVIIVTLTTVLLGVLTFGIAWFLWPVFYITVTFLYRWFTISSRSSTWGMRVMNIELRGPSGAPFSSGEAALHTLAFMVSSAFLLPQVLSILMMMLGGRGQGLHDLLIGSAAINRPR